MFSFLPRTRLVSLAATLVAAFALTLAAHAQSAYYAGVTTTIGSSFVNPNGVAVAPNGDVYVAIPAGRSSSAAIDQIVAGTGGAAPGTVNANSTVNNIISSTFTSPLGVAVDASGNVYVTDIVKSAVYEIMAGTGGAAAGTVNASSTVNPVGSGFSDAPAGVAVDAHGNVFVSEEGPGTNEVQEIEAGTGGAAAGTVNSTSTVATIATTGDSYGIAVDASGNVYFADLYSNEVKEIVATSGVVSSSSTINPVGGTFNSPYGVAVDASGNVYVASASSSDPVEMIVAGTGGAAVGTVNSSSEVVPLGSGFSSAVGVSLDAYGNVYVSDSGNTAVKEIQLPVAQLGTQAVGTPSSTVLVPFGFAASTTLSSINVFTTGATGKDYTQAVSGTTCATGTAYTAGQSCVVAVTFTPKLPGQRLGAVVLNTSASTTVTALLAGDGTGAEPTFSTTSFPSGSIVMNPAVTQVVGSGFAGPIGMAVDAKGDVYVADYASTNPKEILAGTGGAAAGMVNANSTVIPFGGSNGNSPVAVAVAPNGNVFFTTYNQATIVEVLAGTGGAAPGSINANSTVQLITPSGLQAPQGMAFDRYGNLFVADSLANAVKEILAGSGGAPTGTINSSSTVITVGDVFYTPSSVAVDSNGNVYVSDYNHNAVKEILAGTGGAALGTVNSSSTVVTLASAPKPQAVAVDASGNVYFPDGSGIVQEILSGTGGAPAGTVNSGSTIVTLGSGFTNTSGLALDASGNLFVSDFSSNNVKELAFAMPPSLTFPSTDVGTTSATQTVTLQNIGTADLTLPIPTLAGADNPSVSTGFSYSNSSTCTQSGSGAASAYSLASAGTCTLNIAFAPTTTGTISGDVVLTDNSLNTAAPNYATQSIPLSGTGISTLPSTTTALSLSASSISAGASLTLTATVTDASSNPVTYGTVTFYNKGAEIGLAVITGGSAVLNTTALHDIGATTLTAKYNGDYKEAASTSTSVPLTITLNTTTTALSLSASSISAGGSLTLTATVTDASSNPVTYGNVTFYNHGAEIGMAALNSSGVATLTSTDFHDIGATTLTAKYNGDYKEAASTSTSVPLTINSNTTTTTLSLSASTIAAGGSLTLTATVTDASSNPVTYGTVTFYNQTAEIGLSVLNGSGVATLTSTDFHDIGATTLTAKFNGNYKEAASSGSQPLTINGNTTTTALTLSASTISAGAPLTLTATVTGASSTPITYGTVTFYNGGAQIGIGLLNGSGVASVTTTALHDIGNTTLTAKFNGNYKEAASSGSQPLTIQPGVLPQ